MKNKVRELRAAAGMTQQQLAELCGVSRATINGIVCGRSCNDRTGYKIAQALGMELKDLVEN